MKLRLNKPTTWFVAGVLLSTAISPSSAQRTGPMLFRDRAYHLTANATFTSDYIFRGLSLSDDKPAIQGGADYEHLSGFFVGGWASSGSKKVPLEIDLYTGYEPQVLEELTLQASLTGYIYPHADEFDSLEGKLAIYPGPAAVAYYYDFVFDLHYLEVGVVYEWQRWSFSGGGGYVVWQESGLGRPGGEVLPPDETQAWDLQAAVEFEINSVISASAGFTSQEFDGERLYVTVDGLFPVLQD